MRVRWRLPRRKCKNNVIGARTKTSQKGNIQHVYTQRPPRQGPRTRTHKSPYTYQITLNPVLFTVLCHSRLARFFKAASGTTFVCYLGEPGLR